MKDFEILSHVDHTLLKAVASREEIFSLCDEAIKYKTASVCIPPSYVGIVRDKYGAALNICTVIGFPLGYSVTEAKLCEIDAGLRAGANEFDMVVNLGDVKNRLYEKIIHEISALKKAVGNNILKVIIETCYLTAEEKISLCQAVTQSKADYIKTSTGFGSQGAVMEDIRLFKEHIGPDVKIKAAGGIRTRRDMEDFILAGCDRLAGDIRLIRKAIEARKRSYSPYSGFKVGAALLASGGKVFTGCNIENAAFSPTVCAERTAFFKAVSEGEYDFEAIAVVGWPDGDNEDEPDKHGFAYPCGVCRQVMMEFCHPKSFRVIVAASEDDYTVHTLEEILPHGFGPGDLKQ
ncbi:deoxyribose-phosphate aldolase [Holotrichia oblita]|nr:deoxyribose-phosphate aldolase [Holotrichia oblita]